MNPAQNPASQADYYTDLPVGEILRRTRVHYGQSLDDVANYLRIRASQLEAIEKNDVDHLPGRVYAIGYIRTYSEYLGLDGEKMIHLFKQQSGGKTVRPELHFPVPASESKAPNLYVIFGSLAVLALIIGVWIALNAAGHVKELNIAEIPRVPVEMQVTETSPLPALAPMTSKAEPSGAAVNVASPVLAPASSPPLEEIAVAETLNQQGMETQAAATSATAPPAATETVSAEPSVSTLKKEIVITIKDRSWVEVRDKQGKSILSRILKPGEIFIVPESNYGLRLDTGNAGGIAMTVNGLPVPPLGKQGDILRGFVLDGNEILKKAGPAGEAATAVVQ